MTNEAWGLWLQMRGSTEKTLALYIKIVIVLEIHVLDFCIENVSWFEAKSRETFRYTIYDFLVNMGKAL